MRLGVYSDDVYWLDGPALSTDRAFIYFIAQLAPRLSELVLFGRRHPGSGRGPYVLPDTKVRFVPLPYYPSVKSVGGLLRSLGGARRAFVREVGRLDAVLLFGPHPIALEFARLARRERTPVFLGVRQDFPRYIGRRLPGRGWLWAIPAAHGLEQSFRLLARRVPTVVVGEDLAARYARGGAPTLVTGFSLVEASELVPRTEAVARDWSGELRILSVGRIDPEKNPLLLPEILTRLRELDGPWRLTVVGAGPLEEELSRRASALGVADAVELTGYVPYGPRLTALYRASHAFLHVSLTEGVPQVLWEAQAAGLPIVATDVGGVRAALLGGRAGLLVPPRDPAAIVEALERLRSDDELRRRLVAAALENAGGETREVHLERLASFLRDNAL